jgi:Kef-type K+ transport system membrane component KefB
VYGTRESLTIGFLLNTKGLVELVVLNVGLDIGVLTSQVFAIFMIMALW